MKTLILSLICCCLFAAEDVLPSKAAELMKKYDANIAKLKAEYDKKQQDETQKNIEGLQKLSVEYGKKGDLDGALAIKKKMEELQKGMPQGEDLLAASGFDFTGRWTFVEISSFRLIDAQNNVVTGDPNYSGKLQKKENGSYTIKYNNGQEDTIIVVNKDTLTMKALKETYTLVRAK